MDSKFTVEYSIIMDLTILLNMFQLARLISDNTIVTIRAILQSCIDNGKIRSVTEDNKGPHRIWQSTGA